MTFPLICTLLFVGVTANDANAKSRLQAQIGYGITMLSNGDFAISEGFFDINNVFYHPHILAIKIGVQSKKGWELRGIGGVSFSNFMARSVLCSIDDPDPYLFGGYYANISTFEFNAGIEGGHVIKFRCAEGSLYAGIEGIYGRFHTNDTTTYYRNKTEPVLQAVYATTPLIGYKWHLGISLPVASFNLFSLQIHPFIMGGRVITGHPIDLSANTRWFGTHTLSKRGVGIGLTLNYKGENK